MFDNLDDPRQQALLMASLGLLGGGGGKGFGGFARDVSRAGLLGLQGYNQASMAKDKRAEEEQQRQMRQMQMDQMRQGMDWQKAMASGYRPGAPGVTPLTPNDDNGNPMPSSPAVPPGFDFSQAMKIDPFKTIQAEQAMRKVEAPISVAPGGALVDPKTFKPLFSNPKPEKPKFQAGDTREIKSGQKVITQEFDGKAWNTVGTAPLWKPETDKGIAPPQGYRWTQAGGLEPIPGGPADAKVGKEAEKEAAQRDASVGRAKMVLGQIGDAIKSVGPTTAGTGGAILRGIPATGAYNLNKTVDSIKANIGFAELQAMRQASPTGGALGQVAVQELNSLQSVLGSLDTAQSQDQLLSNLYKAEKHYQNWLRAVQESSKGSQSPAQGGGNVIRYDSQGNRL